jgi:hypothetical protein
MYKEYSQNGVTLNNQHIRRVDVQQQKKKTVVKTKRTTVKSVSEPSVVVFDGSVLHKKPTLEDKASKKRFLVNSKSVHKFRSMTYIDGFNLDTGFQNFNT